MISEIFDKFAELLLKPEFNPSFGYYWFWSLVAITIFLFLIIRCKSIKVTAFVVFIAGVIVYGIGYCNEGTGQSVFALVFRSILSSAEMFVGHSDLIEVHRYWHSDTLYMTAFAVVHFFAFLTSLIFVFKTVIVRFLKFVRLTYCSRIRPINKLHVFIGVNEKSEKLARDINREKKGEIIFVHIPRKNELEQEGKLSFIKLLGLTSYYFSDAYKVWEMGINAHFARAVKNLEDLDLSCCDTHVISRELGLRCLGRMINRCTQVKFYILSEDMEYNLLTMDSLIKDKYFKGKEKKKVNGVDKVEKQRLIIYCYATRTSSNLLREQEYLCYNNLEVHIIDSSYLSIEGLKSNPECLPVKCINTSCGAATTKFTALIAGFGETGQQAFDFIYKYSAFTGIDSFPVDTKYIVVDENMQSLSDPYTVRRPGLEEDIKCKSVQFLSYNVNDARFWKYLKDYINDLNYVVIALGDDKRNIDFALALYEYAVRYRDNNLKYLKIFIRAYSTKGETRVNDIQRYINHTNVQGLFKVFGYTDELYNCKQFSAHDWDSEELNAAKKYRENYCELEKSLLKRDSPNWDVRRKERLPEEYLQTNEYSGLFFTIRGLMREEGQDYENYYHMKTKMCLMGLPDNWKDTSQTQRNHALLLCRALGDYIKGNENLSDYSDDIRQTVINLSITEHLRWNRSLIILGYKYQVENSGEDRKLRDVRMTHKCIVPWQELSYDVKKYDAMVVLTTLQQAYPELKEYVNV